ncbi:MAG: Nif3-like dinuclear metal center hexameric protein [Eubacteriales bacterium]|nr:Nif3-like dinuclear metal center hexameric protein [Eubacteriales bacterium]
MQKKKFISIIESICPSDTQEDWDNTGVQINTEFPEVNRVLVSLEINDDVIDEAIEKQADMIVTHHPLIFHPLKRIDSGDVTGHYVERLVKAGISVFSTHTSFDKMDGGNNDYLGRVLGLTEIEKFDNGNEFCRKGVTPFEITFADLMDKTAAALDVEKRLFKATGDPARTITTVGWCTGAGGEFIEEAADEGLDLYITGDLKYHDAQLAKALGICVLDAGHYGTEKIFVDNMADYLCRKTNCEIIKSEIDINPFSW